MKNQWITTAIVAVLTLSFAAPTATAAVQPLLTGVITTKTDQGALLPGVTVEIHSGSCSGPAVWRSTTGSSPSANARFAYSLVAGTYCLATLSVPEPYRPTGAFEVTIDRAGQSFALWQLGTTLTTVAVLDVNSRAVPGVTVQITRGQCGQGGQTVATGVTSADPFIFGSMRFLGYRDAYCATAVAWSADYAAPAPANVNSWLEYGVILWIPRSV